MKKIVLFISCLVFVNTLLFSQTNILLIQKNKKTKCTYFPGSFISLITKQHNYASGIITKIGYDSLYFRYFDIEQTLTSYGGIYFDTAYRYTTAVSYNDIGTIIEKKRNLNYLNNGNVLLIAGGGVLALGAINGAYRGEPPKNWYKPSSYITAGVLATLGIWMKRSGIKKYTFAKKYQLKILTAELQIKGSTLILHTNPTNGC